MSASHQHRSGSGERSDHARGTSPSRLPVTSDRTTVVGDGLGVLDRGDGRAQDRDGLAVARLHRGAQGGGQPLAYRFHVSDARQV